MQLQMNRNTWPLVLACKTADSRNEGTNELPQQDYDVAARDGVQEDGFRKHVGMKEALQKASDEHVGMKEELQDEFDVTIG